MYEREIIVEECRIQKLGNKMSSKKFSKISRRNFDKKKLFKFFL